MKITDHTISSIQFIGVCISVGFMICGGIIYLYNFAWHEITPDRPLAITTSKALLISGIWLLINMQLVRVLMACYIFFKNKEKILSIISCMILLVLFASLYF